MDTLIKGKIQRLKGFLQAIKPNITDVELAIMDNVIRATYEDKGIDKYNDYRDIKPEQYPILKMYLTK